MKIETILRVLVAGVIVFPAGPPQGAEARSLLNSNAVTAVQMTTDVKPTKQHRWRRRHLRHRGWTHHLDPGW
jgi:hypothetical protein